MRIFVDIFDFSTMDIGVTVRADFYKLFDSSGDVEITRINETQFKVSTNSTSDVVSIDNVRSMIISRIEYLQEIGKFFNRRYKGE